MLCIAVVKPQSRALTFLEQRWVPELQPRALLQPARLLAMLLPHPLWGVIALPVLSALYVRQQDVNKLNSRYGWEFKTKHQLGLELVTRLVSLLRSIGCQTQIVLVVDGAYATAMFLKKLHGMNVTLVSRLRRNAVLFGLPPERRVGQRGRPRKYGSNKLSLVKRAASRQGWESITYVC